MTDSGIPALAEAYRQWQSTEILLEYGPLRACADTTAVQRLWRDTIDPAVALVHATETRADDGTYRVSAPSPWHAYFYLRAQQQYIYRAGRPLGAPAGDSATGSEHVFFRGQRCASWEMRSSVRRLTPAAAAIERRAIVALTEYFRVCFVANGDVARNTGACFAQHYGIATDLADITCEPDIAVWFATHPVGKGCPSGESEGVVRAVTWAAQVDSADTLCLLAPPFVRNVYLQRGLFVDTSRTDGRLAGKFALEVRFPRDTVGGEFVAIRRSKPLEVWPSQDDDETELISWARSMGTKCANDAEVATKVREQKDAGGLPEFWLTRDLFDIEKQTGDWLSMLDWVLPATCVTAMPAPPGSPEPMRYEIMEAKVRALVRANPTFFDAFVGAQPQFPDDGFAALKAVLLIAEHELQASGPTP